MFPGRVLAQVTLGFQGGEPGDTWGYVSTGADAVAQAQALMSPNIVTGAASLVVGGNTPGGNCFDVGTGNGPSTARTFTFNNLDISTSNFFTRTLVFNWGNRFPVCIGTGWDTGENLVFTAFHDGVAQPSVTLATGVNNATFNINSNQFTWSVPPCVSNFYFRVTVTTNRRDELLFLDDVELTSPALNPALLMPSPVTGPVSVCTGAAATYSVIQESGVIYTWTGLPAGASFTTSNGTTGAYTIGINWGTAMPGTYTISVTPSNPCGTVGPAQTADITITIPSTVSITSSGPTTFCPGGSVTLTSSAAAGNTWSTGDTGNSIVVSASGTYTVTVATGCGPATASETVTVLPVPVISVNDAVTCPGVPVTLTANGASTYVWSPAAGLSGTTGAVVNATPSATAGYTVSGTDTNGCTGTAVFTVTVNPPADASITPQAALCANSAPVMLTAASPGGIWSAGCGTCIDSLGEFDPVMAGTGSHTVTYLIPGSCGDTSSILVDVLPVPDIFASDQTICSGQTTGIALSSSVPGTGFSWTVTMTNTSGALADSGAVITQTLTAVSAPSGAVVYNITPSAAGCTGTALNITVTVELVSIDNLTATPVSCNGMTDGTVSIASTGGTQYSIDGGMTFQSIPVFTTGPGTYAVEVQNNNGCSASGTATVTEPAVLTVSLAGTHETCAGSCNGAATASATGGTAPYTYAWSNGAGNLSTVNLLCAGVYTVTVTDSNGCTATDSITINSLSGISIDSITVAPVSCNGGNNGAITVYTTPAASQFSIDGGITFQSSEVFSGLTQGAYAIVAQHASGCQATGNVSVYEPAALEITVSPGMTICPGHTATITAAASGGTAPYTYTWDHGLPDTTVHHVSPAATETYTVYITDGNNCVSDSGVITVTVPASLSVTPGSDLTICPGASALISVLASGGIPPYTYTWTNNINTTVLIGSDQLVTPTGPVTYTVTVQDQCGETATDVLDVFFYDLPDISFVMDTGRGCLPLVVNLTSTIPAASGHVLQWDLGDGSSDTGNVVQHVFTGAGCYDVSLQLTTASGCVKDTTMVSAVCVYDVPAADFSFSPAPADVFNPGVNFLNTSTGASVYQWDFGGLGSANAADVSFVFPADSSGSYQVCLAVQSDQGCADSICRMVDITGHVTIYMPNAFTPDGDGLNDYFFPLFGDIDQDNFSFLVFDRWGQVVFEGRGLSARWDGMHNGVYCKQDTYVWKVKYEEGTTGVQKELVGHVNLLR